MTIHVDPIRRRLTVDGPPEGLRAVTWFMGATLMAGGLAICSFLGWTTWHDAKLAPGSRALSLAGMTGLALLFVAMGLAFATAPRKLVVDLRKRTLTLSVTIFARRRYPMDTFDRVIVKVMQDVCWVGLHAKGGASIRDPMYSSGSSIWIEYSSNVDEARRRAERVADFCGLPFEPNLE